MILASTGITDDLVTNLLFMYDDLYNFCYSQCCQISPYKILFLGKQENILCTISLAISNVSHLFVPIFVQYRTILIAMARTGAKANKTTNLQTPSFKYAFGESKNCRRDQFAKFTSVVSIMWGKLRSFSCVG